MTFDNAAATPPVWREIAARSAALGFDMPSDANAGALLRCLAASKPGGRFLELGTGCGLATACLLDGMDAASNLVSVDTDEAVQSVARDCLGDDPRVTFVLRDGLSFIQEAPPASFDLIFADAWPGKYEGLDAALRLLRLGGLYVGDDMAPQRNWPDGHQARVDELASSLKSDPGLATTALAWGTGMIVSTRRVGA